MTIDFTNPVIYILILTIFSSLIGIGVWIGSVNTDRKSFKEFMNEVRDDIKKILDRLPAKAVASGSPIQLTNLGQSISKQIDAKKIAIEHAHKVFDQVKDNPPYEIQEFCMEYVKSKSDENKSIWDSNQLKEFGNCAYENGIPLDQIFDVIAVELRDTLLKLTKTHSEA